MPTAAMVRTAVTMLAGVVHRSAAIVVVYSTEDLHVGARADPARGVGPGVVVRAPPLAAERTNIMPTSLLRALFD